MEEIYRTERLSGVYRIHPTACDKCGFELLEEESTCPLNQVKTEDGWADEIMVHMVRCKHCGQVFTCVVNTYRGSGSFKKGKG